MGGSGLLQSEYQDWKQGKVSCACKTISCPRVSDKSVGQPQMHPAVTAKFWRSNQAPARQGECGGACLRRTSCMFRKTCNGGGLCCAMTLWHLKIVPCPLLLQEASQNELTHIDRRHPNALGRWNLSGDPDAWSKQGRGNWSLAWHASPTLGVPMSLNVLP